MKPENFELCTCSKSNLEKHLGIELEGKESFGAAK